MDLVSHCHAHCTTCQFVRRASGKINDFQDNVDMKMLCYCAIDAINAHAHTDLKKHYSAHSTPQTEPQEMACFIFK